MGGDEETEAHGDQPLVNHTGCSLSLALAPALPQMTGRKGRVVSRSDGTVAFESRAEQGLSIDHVNLREKERFMRGEKVWERGTRVPVHMGREEELMGALLDRGGAGVPRGCCACECAVLGPVCLSEGTQAFLVVLPSVLVEAA